MIIRLAGSYCHEDIPRLARELGVASGDDEVVLDLGGLTFVQLSPLCFLLGKVSGWEGGGRRVTVPLGELTDCLQYMQRMNVFEHWNLQSPESFRRHPPGQRFREFSTIKKGYSDQQAVDLATDLADFLAPGGEDSQYAHALEYALSEIVLNVSQHSRGAGFVGAQHYPNLGMTQIAVIDMGIGVRGSFEVTDSPVCRRIRSDQDAINVALEGKVSSTSHRYGPGLGDNPNQGVGLTLMTEVARSIGGQYTVLSGTGAVTEEGETVLSEVQRYQGTFCAFSLSRERLNQFNEHLEAAKRKIVDGDTDRFGSMFK